MIEHLVSAFHLGSSYPYPRSLLVHNGEEALKLFERRVEENAVGDEIKFFKIFHKEEQKTNVYKSRSRTWKVLYPYTYSNSFQVIFLIFATIGILGIIASAVESWPVYMDCLTCSDPSEQNQAQ